LEEKRINKEMANIRKKFKGLSLTIEVFVRTGINCLLQMGIWMDIRRKSELYGHQLQFDSFSESRYVAKIVFTYILGYKVDIGHMEAVNLIASPKYSEKQIVSSISGRYQSKWLTAPT